MQSSVGVNVPALIHSRDIASLSTRLLFRRLHYPCIDIGNIIGHSETIPGKGCRETSLDS